MAKKGGDVSVSFEETMRARTIWFKYCDSDGITKTATLRTILADMGQTPSQDELDVVLDVAGGKLKFEMFVKYLSYLKREFLKPPPADEDTINAYVAIGGMRDRTGYIDAGRLRNTVNNFKLTIDIDHMIEEVDEDGSGQIEYGEFQQMWGDEPAAEGEVSPPKIVNISAAAALAEDTPSDDERLQALRSFMLIDKSKEKEFARNQSMKRKQSRQKSMFGANRSSLFPPLGKSGRADTGFGETVAEEGEEEETPREEKKEEKLPPVNNDPTYMRYLGTKPLTLGVKKNVTRHRGAEASPPNTARTTRGSPQRTPRSQPATARNRTVS